MFHYSMIDTSCGNLGQVPYNNCKVASSHWIRFTETTYSKLCQQKYKHRNFMEDPSTKRLKSSGQVAFRHLECGYGILSESIYMALVKLSVADTCHTKHLPESDLQEHATKFASTSWNESNLFGFTKMCRYGSHGEASPALWIFLLEVDVIRKSSPSWFIFSQLMRTRTFFSLEKTDSQCCLWCWNACMESVRLQNHDFSDCALSQMSRDQHRYQESSPF